MVIIEPHVHMFSRTTDDYARMQERGIRACVEPSFWLGADRRYAGSFFDYFRLILEFETVRARRFGIDHYCAIGFNPKEAENRPLVDEVLAGMGEYLAHRRCVALGEIGFNHLTDNEEYAFAQQLHIAEQRALPVIVHLPHYNKPEGVARSLRVLRDAGFDESRVYLDHNTEDCIAAALQSECWCGLTVYPISKLTPQRVSAIIKEHGPDRIIVSGSADWGVSDPLSLVKVVDYLAEDGHSDETIAKLVYRNAMAFYGQSPNWQPQFDIQPLDPREFQR
jgi:hypothetical protein